MRNHLVLLILITCLPFYGQSCFGTASQSISVQDDTITVIQTASFCLGFNQTCPHIMSYNFNVVGGEIIIDAFYDLTGAWPQNGCMSTDTIQEIVGSGTYNVVFNTHIEGIDSNYLAESDTTWFVTLDQDEIVESIREVHIYPNPVSTTINIDFKEYNGEELSVQFVNLTGERVYENKLLGNLNSINIQHLKAGVYFVSIGNETSELQREKIVKQ